jgi:hypothetical protein
MLWVEVSWGEVELEVCWLEQLQVVVLQVLYHHRRR